MTRTTEWTGMGHGWMVKEGWVVTVLRTYQMKADFPACSDQGSECFMTHLIFVY